MFLAKMSYKSRILQASEGKYTGQIVAIVKIIVTGIVIFNLKISSFDISHRDILIVANFFFSLIIIEQDLKNYYDFM